MKFRKNAIVGQSGGPTAAINATLAGVIAGAGENPRIQTLYGMRHGIEGLLDGRVVNLSEMFTGEDKLSLLKQTPAAALGSCRKRLPDPKAPDGQAIYEKIFDFFVRYDIGSFFYIGGNDSMDTVAKLSAYAKEHDLEETSFIGVPKTIDNDLSGTDHTPGFGSAAKYIATVMLEILRDTAVYTLPSVTIVEIMGRDAGWLTAASALPRLTSGVAPDLVYLPEVPFSADTFLSDVKEALGHHSNVVVAVSEGIRFSDGRYVGEGSQSGVTDAFGHRYLAGTGKVLEMEVREHLGCKVRSVELNLPQRAAAHLLSATDVEESFGVGKAAVDFAPTASGSLICYERKDDPYEITYCPKNVAGIANRIKTVPKEFIAPHGNNVTDACLAYLAPLIAGEVPLVFESGLPKHFVL